MSAMLDGLYEQSYFERWTEFSVEERSFLLDIPTIQEGSCLSIKEAIALAKAYVVDEFDRKPEYFFDLTFDESGDVFPIHIGDLIVLNAWGE